MGDFLSKFLSYEDRRKPNTIVGSKKTKRGVRRASLGAPGPQVDPVAL